MRSILIFATRKAVGPSPVISSFRLLFTRPVFLKTNILLLNILIAFAANAQQPDVALSIAETKYMQEKVYLQTDKNMYALGDTIWFKAYLVADNLPGPLCKTLYAELLDEKGNVMQRRMMPVLLAGASGDFIVSDTVSSSKVFIRAYTAWMLNFDSTLLYVKPVHILPKKNSRAIPESEIFSLHFFPEGGDLIEGLESHVAFKAATQHGEPFVIKGDILNNRNEKICSFVSMHDGMGYFSLTPQHGETYKAIWKDKNGSMHETQLPVPATDGIVFTMSNTDNRLLYNISRPDNAGSELTRLTVVAQMQQHLVYGAQINMTAKTKVTAPIPTDSLPDGVMQITVFNERMAPVAERLVFVNSNNYSFITDLHLNQVNFAKRARNELQIDAGGSLLTNLSVSVTDADLNAATKNENNIYSQFLLSSDLKGIIYNPAYYFSGDADSVKQHLDLVMMTHGWRRFEWKKLLADQWPVLKHIPDKYLSLQGEIIGLSRTQLYNRNLNLIIKTKNNNPDFFMIPLDAKGGFRGDSMYFFDTAKLYYQLSGDKDKSLTGTAALHLENNYLKAPSLNKSMTDNLYLPNPADTFSLTKNRKLANLKYDELFATKSQILQEVKVITKTKSIKQKLDEEYTSGFFTGGDGYSFSMDEDPLAKASPSVLAYLQSKVAGLQINTTGDGSAIWRGSNATIFLNEIETDINQIQSINMSDVALIKVYRPPFFGAIGGGSGGAIAVYTRKGGASNAAFTGLPSVPLYGYSVVRQFYSPDYSINPDPGSKDYRTTLYWNPAVYFDKNNRRFIVPFFNNDNCKKFRVIVEGINENGMLSREEKVF